MVTPEFILKVVDDVSDQNDQISHQKACHRYLKLVTNKFRIQQMLNTAGYTNVHVRNKKKPQFEKIFSFKKKKFIELVLNFYEIKFEKL